MNRLTLPPPYRAVCLAPEQSAFDEACAAARAGMEEGVIFWAPRADRLDFGLTLIPDRHRRATLPVIYVAALAFADALSTFAPPPTPIGFGWPGDVLIDGGRAGELSLDCAPSAPTAVPAWAALGFELALRAGGDEPGRAPTRTCLAEEGFDDFVAAAQVEGFSRHFLIWLGRWDRDGLGPVAAEWSRRAFSPLSQTIVLPNGRATPLRVDDFGDLRVRQNGRERTLSLDAALTRGGAHG